VKNNRRGHYDVGVPALDAKGKLRWGERRKKGRSPKIIVKNQKKKKEEGTTGNLSTIKLVNRSVGGSATRTRKSRATLRKKRKNKQRKKKKGTNHHIL